MVRIPLLSSMFLVLLLMLSAGVALAQDDPGAQASARTYPSTPPLPASTESYRDIAGLYLLEVPHGWNVVRWAWLGFHQTVFTPFEGVQQRQDPPVGVAVSYEFFRPGQALLDLPIEVLGPRLVQYLLFDFRRLREDPNARALQTSGGVSYFTTSLAGQLRDCDDEVVARVMFARAGNLVYTVMAWCRASDAASHMPALGRVLSGFLPTPTEECQAHREERPLEPFDLARKHKASVVLVTATWGPAFATGSGFLVREDGYILTNHHVVFDDKTRVASTDITVHWDESLDMPSLPARLVAAYRGPAPLANDRTTIDVALLKVDGTGYEPLPLTPSSAVELGDPVMTMGYPMATMFKGTSVFVTTGTLTRFNRRLDGAVNCFYIDAKFTHGNSGGPCIDRMTGGVLGINTFVMGEGTPEAMFLYGYNGVLPIDVALDKFPQIVCYPPGALDAIDAEDHRELGFVFLARNRVSAAMAEFQEAIRLDPGEAVAYVGLAECQSLEGTGNLEETLARAEALVKDDLREREVLEYLSAVHLYAGRPEKCLELSNRVVRHVPERWAPYVQRGRALARLGRKEEAYRDLALARKNLLDLLPDAHVEWGRAALDLGDLDTARTVLTEAVGKFPSSLEAHLELAECLARAGDAGAALAQFTAKEREFRTTPVFFARWGDLLRRTGSPDAFLAYDRAMDLYTDIEGNPPFEVAEATGWVHLDRAEVQLAFDGFQVAMLQDSTTPRAASVFAGLARALVNNGKGLAWAHVARAQELNPQDPQVQAAAAVIPRAELEIAGVVLLTFQLGYPGPVIAGLVAASKTTYDLTPEQAADLVKKGLDPVVADALLKASPTTAPQEAPAEQNR